MIPFVSSSSRIRRVVPRAAFTLIEMLLVVAVLAILLGSAAPAVLGMMKSSRLTSAGDMIVNQLTEAQFIAVSESTDVEVRFYELPDFSEVDTTPKIRGIQLFVLRALEPAEDGTSAAQEAFQPATPIMRLDRTIAMSQSEIFSSVMTLRLKEDADNTTGPSGANLRYVAFRFHSDGSTDLFTGQPWFLTLVDEEVDQSATAVPKNYFTVQVDPDTGKLRTFRP